MAGGGVKLYGAGRGVVYDTRGSLGGVVDMVWAVWYGTMGVYVCSVGGVDNVGGVW